MKKLIAILVLCFICVFCAIGFVACGDGSDNVDEVTTEQGTTTPSNTPSAPSNTPSDSGETPSAPTISAEVTSLINEINNLDATDRTAVEAAYKKYKALTPDDRADVSNYTTLKNMMYSIWEEDVATAQSADPDTILFFGDSFGEWQITKVDEDVASYGWTNNLSHGDDNGSMKLTFQSSTVTWNDMETTAKDVSLPNGTMIEFYVYNYSEQEKGLKVGSYPAGTFVSLAVKEWTKISCEAKYLTENGLIRFVGLTDGGGAATPAGDLYFSSVKTLNPTVEAVKAARTGEDVNTVFFFNNELALNQIDRVSGGNVTDITVDTTKNMTKIDINTLGASTGKARVSYDACKYTFNTGDYVIFEAYLDVAEIDPSLDADKVEANKCVKFRFSGEPGTSYGTIVYDKGWATVLAPATGLNGSGEFLLECGAKLQGSLYIGKAKAIPASAVKDIASVGSSTAYTLNGVNFVSAEYANPNDKVGTNEFEVAYDGIGKDGLNVGAVKWSTDGNVFCQAADVVPYYVNGEIRFYMNKASNQFPSGGRIVLRLPEKRQFTSGSIQVTARGVNITRVYLRSDTHTGEKLFDTGVDAGNGYKTFTSGEFNSSWAGEYYDYIVLQVTPTAAGTYSQGSISAIVLP